MDLPLRRCSFQSRISARIALHALSATAGLKLLTVPPDSATAGAEMYTPER
jgi:hypothetical protein